LLFALYHTYNQYVPQTNAQRDTRIRERYAAGETISDLARAYGVSAKRVWQIVRARY
jgi:Mor family transcriptional regulator